MSAGARLRVALATVGIATATLTTTAVTVAAPAQAYTTAQLRVMHVNAVMKWTAAQKGKPYRWGAAGPSAFDCSGLVQYVLRHGMGKYVAHNAELQYRASQHISRASLRVGDLVFLVDSHGYAYHVGIYAGNGYIWHAPHTGTVVKKVKMWPDRWRYGRIIH
jgi:cell wall-associated NlpC family hydrolase